MTQPIHTSMREFFQRHRKLAMVILSGMLWIVELFCPDIATVQGQRLNRELLSVDVIFIRF